MGSITLLLGIHNHQPQGNFEHLFARGYEDCYRPLLELIERHPGVKLTLHYSGPLIDWLERNHRDFIDTLAQLVDRGQVEVMGGGYYEPILTALPEGDALGQLEKMAEVLEGRLGQRPRGVWLAERVWEPELARLLSTAGFRYTLLDDGQFLAAGVEPPLHGYYLTDRVQHPLCLFPISADLRRAIPLSPVEEVIDMLRTISAAADGEVTLTYGDDGEKFGMWPDTKQRVWGDGWLERLFSFLESGEEGIRTATFSEVLERTGPRGRVYPPSGSYGEMGLWSLPPAAQRCIGELRELVAQRGMQEQWGPFVRGGLWQGFLSRYPEANFMHKRMCHVSRRVAKAAAGLTEESPRAHHKALSAAREELYRGQCNCAYWHGVFGGIYSPKLRGAIHSHLIRAEREIELLSGRPHPMVTERTDLDADLHDEVLLTGRSIGAIVSAARGGALLALDDRERAVCLSDVLTRRSEAYHEELQGGGPAAGNESPATAQLPEGSTQATEVAGLVYDPYQRLAFVDQFFSANVDLQGLIRGDDQDLGDFRDAAYDLVQLAGGMGRLMLSRRGAIRIAAETIQTLLRKSYHLEQRGLTVDYEITPAADLSACFFGTEVSLIMPAGPHPEVSCSMVTAGEAHSDHITASDISREVSRVEISDGTTGAGVTLLPRPSATALRFPIYTTSQSDAGLERIYQGTVIQLLWSCHIAAGECFKPAITLQLK